MRLVWLTDIHLNFTSAQTLDRFLATVRYTTPDALLIGGDIAEGHNVIAYLERIADAIPVPIHFVFGNHDFYGSSVRDVRHEARKLCARRPQLSYLTRSFFVPLDMHVALLGHDGWGDGREGDYAGSTVELNDNHYIKELRRIDRATRAERLADLGDEAAEHLEGELHAALDEHSHALLLTHVPPWHAACWHQGRLSDPHWTPFFVCKAAGEAIERVMLERPDRKLLVLCGHTHGHGEAWPLPNVRVVTGAAEYGAPGIAGVIESNGDVLEVSAPVLEP